MTSEGELLEDTAEDLFESAPCGYLATRPDGTIVRVNRTFEEWTGMSREDLLGRRRFQELLSPGGRIYHETHIAPLLAMQGSAREIAVEIVRADGSRLPALVNAVVRRDADDRPRVVRITVFDATDRRRYEQELLKARRRDREIARQLQQSMLSGALPVAPGLDVDVAYRPAIEELDVGGDWYDAFWLDEGRTAGLVVGDVVGRGIEAAAAMGQLRSAVRALASTGLGPAALLDALDAFTRRHGVGAMTTVVYAELDLDGGELRFACAGHPPPLLVVPGEEPAFAWEGRSPPLDALVEPRPRREAHRRLPPGAAVVLYTDGLVERRSRSLQHGMERLLAQVTASRDAGAAALVAGVLEQLPEGETADDICVLAARLERRRRPR
ncbi:MAG TPA: SpoIIE family protein phosphatase [Capillimicrobium sp.]|nr:SpoIIE family protein phosphatase [Capillimicrobium sp.]